MSIDIHCPMIHNGLQLYFKKPGYVLANHCCLRGDLFEIDSNTDFWNDKRFSPLREINNSNVWDSGCENCRRLENTGFPSFRTGTLEMFGRSKTGPGPKRIDLMFDISCNLACRTCGPKVSTFWQKHLSEHGEWTKSIDPLRRSDEVVATLKNMDLSKLELVVFCGGETLLGSSYWEVSKELCRLVPDAKQQLVLSFQTNGTQKISQEWHDTINEFKLVKLNISLDAVDQKFEYLRWPAKFQQVVDNMRLLREELPSNVMFLIEETISIFNLYYLDELEHFLKINFPHNREGDIVDHSRHLANGIYGLGSLSREYYDHIKSTRYSTLLPDEFDEDESRITKMLEEIEKFDSWRQQDWKKIFPHVASFYHRYL
jgi:sulfatase maturation enzyme AslB (radical SAM superfamily)